MPGLAVLRPAADVRQRVDTAHPHPLHERGTEIRRLSDIESAVGVEQSRILAVELDPFFVTEEHGNARSIFAGIENLLGFVRRQIHCDLALANYFALSVSRSRRKMVGAMVKPSN